MPLFGRIADELAARQQLLVFSSYCINSTITNSFTYFVLLGSVKNRF